MPRTSEESLKLLTDVVWQADGNEGNCPPDRYPTFRQLNDLITTTAWGAEARDEFAQRWHAVEATTDRRFEALNFAELAHLVWDEAAKKNRNLKHPLAPLISAWQSGPLEVQAVRTSNGNLRADVIMPRVAMRRNLNSGTDRLYMTPAHTGGTDAEGSQIVIIWLQGWSFDTGRIPVLPVNLYDLGVEAGEARGGRGGRSNCQHECWLNLPQAHHPRPCRHGERFVTYQDYSRRPSETALYPTEYLDGRRQPTTLPR